MSASDFSVVTLTFPDPEYTAVTSDDIRQLNSSLSFQYGSDDDVRTLSTVNTKAGNDLTGLLYIPDPAPGSSCNDTAHFVPANATRASNLPRGGNFAFMAIAPWISPDCTLAYLAAAKNDPLRAFIFFVPDNGTDAPESNSDAWSLGDGGKWKSNTKFPVYAIPGSMGSLILDEMALYSGNLTSVPNGHELADELSPNSYVRLALTLDIEGGTTLPSLWIFLLIVLGILMVIIAFSSFMMHYIHRKRRERLRRRIANGDVDLERLGIRRLTVPRAVLDKMPLYTYPVTDSPMPSPIISQPQPKDAILPVTSTVSSLTAANPTADVPQPSTSSLRLRRRTVFSQNTCPICLDDFVAGECTVRELPCQHIFHPECVDTFLRENSPLCPVCKKSSLPKGYCPPIITNTMVRRERMVRRMRERVPGQHDRAIRRPLVTVAGALNWSKQIFSRPHISPSDSQRPPAVEMRDATSQPAAAAPTPTTAPTPTLMPSTEEPAAPLADPVIPPQDRPELARQRALAMIGNDGESDEERRPLWRRAVSKIWPGLV